VETGVRFPVSEVWLRPYPGENTASRPISHSQAPESLVSIVVGDHTRILGAVIFLEPMEFNGVDVCRDLVVFFFFGTTTLVT
jgi:hypothetical protein